MAERHLALIALAALVAALACLLTVTAGELKKYRLEQRRALTSGNSEDTWKNR